MPTILLKKSDTPGSVPGTANLTNLAGGVEVAVNTADKRVYSMTSASAVIELGTNPSSLTCSDVSATVLRSASATITNLIATSASITTLTNNPTFSAGTANGVLYLNGSKVATSGSALVFDGTNLGVGVTLSAWKSGARAIQSGANGYLSLWEQTNGSTNLGFGVYESASNTFAYRTTGDAPALYSQLSGQHIWSNAASGTANATFSFTELMRLTSTGLGIGTASPAAKLDVAGTFNGTQAVFGNTSGRGLLIGTALNGGVNEGSTVLNARGAGNGQFLFQTDGNTRLTLNDTGNLGIGVTPSAWGLGKAIEVGNAGNSIWGVQASDLRIAANMYYDGAAYRYVNSVYSAWLGVNAAGNGGFSFNISNNSPSAGGVATFSQAMTLDASGQLLLGTTTSGTYKLDIVASNAFRATSGSTSAALFISAGTPFFGSSTNHPFVFMTNETERARIDTSGNLGLGVTPSAWTSLNVFQASRGSVAATTAEIDISHNAYYDGAWKYIANGFATNHYQASGAYVWRTAASGTAGNAISFTQAMTLDADGELGVGITSPTARVHAYSTTAMKQLTVDGAGAIKTGVNFASGGTTYGQIYFDNNSPYDMSVVQQYTTGSLIFGTNSTERGRFTSAGNFEINGGTGARTLLVQTNTSGDPMLTLSAAGADSGQFWFERSTVRLYARASNTGGVYLASGGTSWTAVSDERKKDIIEPISNAAEKVASLRAVVGKYKTDKDGVRRSFLIAQDVQAVFPEAIDASDQNELGLSYTDTIPLLVAAIKELKAELDAAKVKIAALEAK